MTSFGDRVRIKESAETKAMGVAGCEGDVYGFTTPSVTSVVVIGGAPEDHALNVSIQGHGELWFRPDLVELIHHNVGLEVLIGKHKAVRQPDGSWSESKVSSPSLLSRMKRIFSKQ